MGSEIGFGKGEVSAGSIGWSMSHGNTEDLHIGTRLICKHISILIDKKLIFHYLSSNV